MTSLTVTPTGTRRPTFEQLASRLAWARESAGITQAELAAQLGISRRTVSNYETGAQRPKLNRLVLWANTCDVDASWLAGGDYGDPVVTPHDRAPVTRRELSCAPVTRLVAA
jgi:transcriptional regulator with XRE-family HTH domain